MLFCQLAQAKRLREISGGLSCCLGKLRHLGVKKAPNKSTLPYANAHRPWPLYRDLFYQTLETCKMAGPSKHRFRFKNKLLSLDSSTLSLCLSLFPWAKFRRTKGAVKRHLLLDHDGYLPTFAHITNGKKHDVTIARLIPLGPYSIVAMDRGYNDDQLFAHWTENQIFFVTRLKDNPDQVPQLQGQIRLVAVEPCGVSALESVYLPGFMGLDRPSLRCSADNARVCPKSTSLQRSWTASIENGNLILELAVFKD